MGMIGNTPYNGIVQAANLAPGAAVGNLGYTPVNKAGDTMSGALNKTLPTLGSVLGNSISYETLQSFDGSNGEFLTLMDIRNAAGSTWNTVGTRIQKKIDGTHMGYVEFNGGVDGGVTIGTGLGSSPNGSGIQKALIADSAGRISMPFTPAFSQMGGGYNATKTTGAFSAALGDSVSTVLNVTNSGFNTSNGQFTAPISGLYEFTANVCLGGTPGDIGIAIRKNGADIAYQLLYRNAYNGNSAHTKAYLVAGDTIVAYIIWNNSSTSNIYASQFSGQLIG